MTSRDNRLTFKGRENTLINRMIISTFKTTSNIADVNSRRLFLMEAVKKTRRNLL